MTLSNCELFRKYVREGSREAISQFFQNQTDLFYRIALKYTKNSADAEDVLQASFLKIIDKAKQYKGVDSNEEKLLLSWCLTVVVNSALKKIQSETVRKKNESNYIAIQEKEFNEEVIMASENDKALLHKKVQEAILQLPEKYRIPIHLKYVEGFELEAIEGILKLNGNTLRSIIKRGLEKLSDQLKAERVTVSSVALVGLLQQLPLETAPIHAKAIAVNIFNPITSSRRLAAQAVGKSSFFSIKSMLISLLTVVTVAGATIFYTQSKSNSVDKGKAVIAENTKKSKEIEVPKIGAKDERLDGIWLQGKEYVESVKLVMGSWSFVEGLDAVAAPVDESIIFTLPIKPQAKPFVIECEASVVVGKKTNHSKLFFRSYWVKDEVLLGCESFMPIDRYTYDKPDFYKQMIYVFDNYVCVFIKDKCFLVNRYQEFNDASIGIFSKNFAYRKVSTKTLDEVPDFVRKSVNDLTKLKPEQSPSWQIDAKSLKYTD